MVMEQNVLPKWKRYEEFVADLQKKFSPDSEVKANDRIKGVSGTPRQIDVSIREKIGQFTVLIVIDCKDWKSPVDIKAVEEFAGLVEDVKANKGAMVCNAGFTEAAKNRAKHKGIDLFRAVDTESKDWPVYASIPTLVDQRSLKSFRITFSGSGSGTFRLPYIDPRLIEIFSSGGEKIDSVGNLIKKAWNDGKLIYEPGQYEKLPIYDRKMFTKVGETLYGPIDIKVLIIVEKTLYFGQWPLTQAIGFKNELSGSFTTNSITTSDLDMHEVINTWQIIDDIGDLAVEPVFTLRALSYFPLVKEP